MQVALTALLGVEHPRPEVLIPALRHENRAVRTAAAVALAKIRPLPPEVVPVLLEWPDDDSWPLNEWAPTVPSVKDNWIEFKDDQNIQAKSWALASCGRYLVPRLLTANRYASDSSARCAGSYWNYGLLRRDARAVVPMFIGGLHHEDPRVRQAAAAALGSLGIRSRRGTRFAAGRPRSVVRRARRCPPGIAEHSL